MTRYILILIFLGTFWACDDDIQEPATAKFEMNFTAATSTSTSAEVANLIKHMRIFLFDKLDGTLKHEVKNLVRTATSVSSGYFPVGTWHMIAVSNLEDEKADFAPEESRDIKKLLYEFTTTANAGGGVGGEADKCPQIVTYSSPQLEVAKDTVYEFTADFTRAVGKVSVVIKSVEHQSINFSSSEHTVEIINVPTSLNFFGELLDETNIASRGEPVILASTSPMRQPITISNGGIEDISKEIRSDFIIPAYVSGTKEQNKENKKLIVKIQLKKNDNVGGGFYVNRKELEVSLVANQTLNVNIRVLEQGINITTSVSAWITHDDVILPPFI